MSEHNYNPLGTDGFEFVEYTAPTAEGIQQLKDLFTTMGFTEIARHRSKDAVLFRQGDINFIVNSEPYTHFQEFAKAHGPCACAMAFRVKDAKIAHAHAVANGAKSFEAPCDYMELRLPAVYGIGNSVLYFIDRYGADRDIYDIDFVYYEGVGVTG